MSGNSFGTLFTLSTFGESHGIAIGALLDGCPPGLAINEADLQHELDRRRPGSSNSTTQRSEQDRVRIISGVFDGVTTGTSIGLLIENKDHRTSDYTKIKKKFRPSHADYAYHQKYGHRDSRGGGRSSARETVMRVAAGALAKKYLACIGIKVRGYISQLGVISLPFISWKYIDSNPYFCAAPDKVAEINDYIKKIRSDNDSVGAMITVVASGVPPGFGEPVFDRLSADIAHGLMSINAVKGVEIGDGFACVTQHGSEHRDEITNNGFLSNHAGGILGGISSGQPLIARIALKPTSSISVHGSSIDINGQMVDLVTKGRHDPCVGIRALPIAEAMMAITIMDHLIRHRSQNGDVTVKTPIL